MAGRRIWVVPIGDLGTGFCAKEFGSVLGLCRDAEGLELCGSHIWMPKHIWLL